jgi:hypothetical protein
MPTASRNQAPEATTMPMKVIAALRSKGSKYSSFRMGLAWLRRNSHTCRISGFTRRGRSGLLVRCKRIQFSCRFSDFFSHSSHSSRTIIADVLSMRMVRRAI